MNDLKTIDFLNGKYDILLSEAQIQQRIKEMAAEISRDYVGKTPVFIGVLNGAFIFMADLVKRLSIDCEMDFTKISSYGNETYSSGEVKLKKPIDCHVEGRDVIFVEDIVDTGLSVRYLIDSMAILKPKSFKFVSLLKKDETCEVDLNIDYVGFNIPNKFVVGYGLDIAQKLRNLPAIYVLNED